MVVATRNLHTVPPMYRASVIHGVVCLKKYNISYNTLEGFIDN